MPRGLSAIVPFLCGTSALELFSRALLNTEKPDPELLVESRSTRFIRRACVRRCERNRWGSSGPCRNFPRPASHGRRLAKSPRRPHRYFRAATTTPFARAPRRPSPTAVLGSAVPDEELLPEHRYLRTDKRTRSDHAQSNPAPLLRDHSPPPDSRTT